MKMKTKTRLYGYDKNRPKSRHGDSKYRRCLSIVMLICIKQHLSNIWSSIIKKLSNAEDELKKNVAYKKTCSAHGYLLTLEVFNVIMHFLVLGKKLKILKWLKGKAKVNWHLSASFLKCLKAPRFKFQLSVCSIFFKSKTTVS